jgi:hypothetical protein
VVCCPHASVSCTQENNERQEKQKQPTSVEIEPELANRRHVWYGSNVLNHSNSSLFDVKFN